jgi:hypothetical protein
VYACENHAEKFYRPIRFEILMDNLKAALAVELMAVIPVVPSVLDVAAVCALENNIHTTAMSKRVIFFIQLVLRF